MPDISIGRLRGGFCVYWHDETGARRRYQLKARTRAEAEGEALDVWHREHPRRDGFTVAEIWEAYRAALAGRPTAETMAHTGKAILAHFGHLRPDQIGEVEVGRYRDARLHMAHKRAGTVHTELGHLRSALRYAAKRRMIDRAPHIPLPPKPDSKVEPLTDAQIRALLDGAGAPHVRLAIVLLLTTGARVGAILDLTWDRVDLERGVIDLRLPDGVTRKGRAVVPINRMARAALETAYPARLTDYVVEWAGKRVRSIRTGYAAAQKRAGLSGIHIHQIRHTVAVRMLAAGRPIEEVSQFLGHSNVAITFKTYARFRPEHLAEAAAVLEFNEPRATSQISRKALK